MAERKSIYDRKAFNFYRSYYETAKMLDNNDRLKFYDAIIKYQFEKIEITLEGMSLLAFTSQKHNIISQVAGFENVGLRKNNKGIFKAPTEAPAEQEQEQVQVQVQEQVQVQVQDKEEEKEYKERVEIFNFKKELINLGVDKKIVDDWIKVRKQKKASNTETAFNSIKNQIEKSPISANDCIRISAERSWAGFNHEWIKNENKELLPNKKQRQMRWFTTCGTYEGTEEKFEKQKKQMGKAIISFEYID